MLHLLFTPSLGKFKKSKFSSQIIKLLSVVSTNYYDELKHEYETYWKTLDIDDVNKLNKYLSKIGLVLKKSFVYNAFMYQSNRKALTFKRSNSKAL